MNKLQEIIWKIENIFEPIKSKSYDEQVKLIKDLQEKEQKAVEDKYSKEEEQLKKFNEVWFSGMQKRNDSDKNDAILDRSFHNAYRIYFKGASLRKKKQIASRGKKVMLQKGLFY